MSRRTTTKLLYLLALLLLCGPLLRAQAPKPNVILITVDDLNDYVGFLEGHPQAETPNMDDLARRGVVFTNAYCNSPSCAPSRTSMLLGKRPEYTGVFENEIYNENQTFRELFADSLGNGTIFTLPEIMKDQGGYFTFNLMKIFHGWYYQGFDNDFDETVSDPCAKGQSWSKLIDFRPTNNPDPITDNPHHHGFLRYKFGPVLDSQEPEMNEVKSLDSLVLFLEAYETLPSQFCDRPFFVAFGTSKPHVPYYVPERYYLSYYENDIYKLPYTIPYNNPPELYPPNGLVMPKRFPDGLSGRETLGIIGENSAKGTFFTEDLFRKWAAELSPRPVIDPSYGPAEVDSIAEEVKKSQAVMSYLASIKFADFQVGRILNELDKRPQMRDNTIIVLVSDHGYSMGEREHWHKFGLWETDIRIPMIVVDPRSTNAGKVSGEMVSLLDVYPTVLEMAGVPEPTFPDGSRYLDGRSLVPFMDDPSRKTSHAVVTSFKGPERLPEGGCFPHYSIRNDQFHYIHHRTNAAFTDSTGTPCDYPNSRLEEEFYELGKNREIDPEEFINLAADPNFAEDIAFLNQWLPGGPFENTTPPDLQIDPASIPCLLSMSDTLTPKFLFTAADGSPAAMLPEYNFEWKLDPPGWSSTNDSLILSLLPLWTLDQPLRLAIKMTSSLDSSFFLYHSIPITIHSATPNPAFTATLDDRIVSLSPLGNLPANALSQWTYGDGFSYEGDEPLAHQYSSPGNFNLQRTLTLPGVGDNCVLTASQTVNVPASLFPTDTCFAPVNFIFEDISSGKVKLSWSAVAGATDYELRAKRARFQFDDPWVYRTLSGTSYTSPAVLKPNTEYILELAANCPAGQSEWSYPLHITSSKCDPPRNINTIFLEPDRAIINWTQNPDPMVSGAQVGYAEVGTTNLMVNTLGSSVTTFELSGLTAGATYEMRGWSKCTQLTGPALAGDKSTSLVFTTPTTRDFNSLPFTLSPNPARNEVRLQVEMFRVEGEIPAQITITDLSGKVVYRDDYVLDSTGDEIFLRTANLPQGLYLVTVKTAKAVGIRTFMRL